MSLKNYLFVLITLAYIGHLNLITCQTSPSSKTPVEIQAIISKYSTDDAKRCGDTGNCNRKGCNDTISSPVYECLEHVDSMECFRVCKDPQILTDCLKDHPNAYAYCAITFRRLILSSGGVGVSTDHIALPCKLKCMIDPTFWSCVHRCDERGCFQAFKDCETKPRNKSEPNSKPWCDTTRKLKDYLSDIQCRDCYVSNLTTELETHQECNVRYSYYSSAKDDLAAGVPTTTMNTSSSSTTTPTPILLAPTSPPPSFAEVQPKCIYSKEIVDRKKPDINQTFPFEMINLCLSLQGIIFNDSISFNNTNMTSAANASVSSTTNSTTGVNLNSTIGANLTANYLENCVALAIASQQISACTGNGFFTVCEDSQGKSIACHEACLRHLTKPYCYMPCPRNVEINLCEEECARKYPLIECECEKNTTSLRKSAITEFFLDVDARLENFNERTRGCKDAYCYYLRIHDTKPDIFDPLTPKPAVDDWEDGRTRMRNCRSFRHYLHFAKKLGEVFGRPNAFDDDIYNLADHYTMLECKKHDCKDTPENDAAHCASRCIRKKRGAEETDVNCDDSRPSELARPLRTDPPLGPYDPTSPNYLRGEIVMWCLLTAVTATKWDMQTYYDLTKTNYKYKRLVTCEAQARQMNETYLNQTFFQTIARITYEIEREFCDECINSKLDERPHDYDMSHVECEIGECYEGKMNQACTPLKSTSSEVRLVSSTDCSWKVDFSLSLDPYRLWSTYFDDISPFDALNDLRKPNTTNYLMKSSVTFGKGYYVLPYFVVIRAFCDDGFYDEEVYKFIASGAVPDVGLRFFPYSSRSKIVNLMYSEFQAALINLERLDDSERRYVPFNKMNRKLNNSDEFDGKSGCHMDICYPAFAVPQVLLHVPILEIQVKNQQVFSAITSVAYTNTMHNRDVPGRGRLKVANHSNYPTADLYFPKLKTQVYEDVQLISLWDRLPDSGFDGDNGNSPGPEIGHFEDENCMKFPEVVPFAPGGNPFSPLDTEDFIRVQYTHGNAPVVVIAGFYDPNLIIIGDPDMNKFELLRWGFEASGGTVNEPVPKLFSGYYECLSNHYPIHGHAKPMYSMYDRLDPLYWLQFYRMRYSPKNYRDAPNSMAIFEAFALEDRLLLLTTGGLVSIFQNYNQTAMLGLPWEVSGRDQLEKCFKIVRTARRSHISTDTIVAITYDYQVLDPVNKNQSKDVSQEVYLGRYTGVGVPIEWEKIEGGISTQNLKEERVYNVGGDKLGEVEPLPHKKVIDVPVERRETNPRSQIEAICYIVYRTRMGKAEYIELIEDQGWCDAIDATPVVAVESKIQVLVRMKAYYSGGKGSGVGSNIKRMVFFYVVASINTDKAASLYSVWQIDAIIPRIPCLDEHTQSIPNVVQFSIDYFRRGDPETVGVHYGCHEQIENKRPDNQIYLHGMTYTRNFNNHMFLYGNKLLQSTDGGTTFVHLKSFPARESPDYQVNCLGTGKISSSHQSKLAYHRIKLMAFDDLGHYAFLTSKRELWYGNLGNLEQIRLRPSSSHSMSLTTLYEVREISEAVPFTLFFDSNNELIEMVAVVDEDGTVSRIARRRMDERTILRARHYIEQIQKEGDRRHQKLVDMHALLEVGNTNTQPVIEPELLTDIRLDPIKWSVFCPFASPSFYHNFSMRHARSQKYFFQPPRQHPSLGLVHNKTSLMTYQATTFALVWNSFFSDLVRIYSHANEDPFLMWRKLKQESAVIGRLEYLNLDPEKYGVMVLPDKYRRIFDHQQESHRVYLYYYMDYNVIIQLSIEYSISNDYTLNPIDYLNHHLSAIQLNVDNSNGSLIQINTEKEIVAERAAVRYVIHISIKKHTGLPQQFAGRNTIIVPIYFHLIGGFGKCIKTESTGILGDSIATAIAVGCPPSTELVFDWKSTAQSIKFRDVDAHYGILPNECYEGEMFCFFSRYPLVLHFHIFDDAKQQHYNFSGKFMMRVVGGGYSKDDMTSYSIEEQEAYNVPGVSDVSLIWNEWDRVSHQKKEHKDSELQSSREIILEAGKSAIKWACHSLSPCARINPSIKLESVFYFRIFVTNRGVDNDTLCLFEKEFDILLYGFPPGPEIQLATTVLFYILIFLVLYMFYLFFRDKKKLWRSTLLRLQGWFQIVRDTFPKSVLTREEVVDEETDLERQKRQDEILLFLQGHLNVPRLDNQAEADAAIAKEEGEGQAKPLGDTSLKPSHHTLPYASQSSLSSVPSSSTSQSPIMNPVTGRAGAATWSDMIYEEIISKRLAAIVEKNRKEAEEEQKAREEAEVRENQRKKSKN